MELRAGDHVLDVAPPVVLLADILHEAARVGEELLESGHLLLLESAFSVKV